MVQQNDNSIQVQWSDNHRSDYQLDWLKLRDFDLENRKKYLEEIYRPKSSHWNKQNFTQTLRSQKEFLVYDDREEAKNQRN